MQITNRYISYLLLIVALLLVNIFLHKARAEVNPALLSANLIEPIKNQLSNWPGELITQVENEQKRFLSQAKKVTTIEEFESLRLEYTKNHRKLAKQVYGADTLVWQVLPDEDFVMLSLPTVLNATKKASLDTVINALEATAFGVANLTDNTQLLEVSIFGNCVNSPLVTPRIARFSRTKDSRYVPDALLLMDGSYSIPSGESKLLWIGVETTNAKAGTYLYEIKIKVGNKLHLVPLEIIVHDITLPKETSLATFNWSYLDSGYGFPVYKEVRKSMLKHRITIGANTATGNPKKDEKGRVLRPVEIDYTELDKFIEFNQDFKEISFFWPFHRKFNPPTGDMFGKAKWMSDEYKAIFKEWLVKFVARLKIKGRDYNSFHFQMFDETTDNKLVAITKLVHDIDPNVRMMITIPSYGDPQKLVDAGMNIVVYHAPFLSYQVAPESFKTVLSSGNELWLYNAGNKTRNGRDRDPLNIYRLLHWLAFRHGATGVGFWNLFHDKQNGWADDVQFFPMLYSIPDTKSRSIPADVNTHEMVIPSRRFEYTRMGIEDYMLLQMAQEKISKLEVNLKNKLQFKLDYIVKTVTVNLPQQASTESRQEFRSLRKSLIDLLDTLGNK